MLKSKIYEIDRNLWLSHHIHSLCWTGNLLTGEEKTLDIKTFQMTRLKKLIYNNINIKLKNE